MVVEIKSDDLDRLSDAELVEATFYEARGDLMSAIYCVGSSARAQTRVALHSAHAADSNLGRAKLLTPRQLGVAYPARR
jgi:hypothetical protein